MVIQLLRMCSISQIQVVNKEGWHLCSIALIVKNTQSISSPTETQKPYTQMKPSTLTLLKESVETKPPRKALRDVENLLGGVMGAKLACDLPRDRKQVKNLKYNSSGSFSTQTNVLTHVKQMCRVLWLRRYVCSVLRLLQSQCVC